MPCRANHPIDLYRMLSYLPSNVAIFSFKICRARKIRDRIEDSLLPSIWAISAGDKPSTLDNLSAWRNASGNAEISESSSADSSLLNAFSSAELDWDTICFAAFRTSSSLIEITGCLLPRDGHPPCDPGKPRFMIFNSLQLPLVPKHAD